MPQLPRDEWIEQAYLYRAMLDRLGEETSLQDLLAMIGHELLATTNLSKAVSFLLAELKHTGVMAAGMARLSHYFTSFQTFLVAQSENDRGRFDFRMALRIMQREAEYRADNVSRQGVFFYQFECLCRNRLSYDGGLAAMADDPIYDEDWRQWLLIVRRQLGLVDLADLIYGRSEDFVAYRKRRLGPDAQTPVAILFGEKEGKIAYANRRRDPLYLFSAMQRHLSYPSIPRPERIDTSREVIPQMQRRIERLESRIKLMEDEQRAGGIDLSRFFGKGEGA